MSNLFDEEQIISKVENFKIKKLDLFKEILPSIMQTKENVLTEENEKEYNPFMVNRALSLHNDCLFYANQMNLFPHLSKISQYQYYMHSIRGMKRNFIPWPKKQTEDVVKVLMWYFNYSERKALEATKILSEEQISNIEKEYETAHS